MSETVVEKREPLCLMYKDLLDPGVMDALGLDKDRFEPAFIKLRDYWKSVLRPNLRYDGNTYLLCTVLQLNDILETPEDWEEVGTLLADGAVATYENGSHDFVQEAVTALIDSGITTTKGELMVGIGTLLETIGSKDADGQWLYDGGHAFPLVAEQMRGGEITSLDDIRASYPPAV